MFKLKSNKGSKSKAFTLIELLVVIAIIGILVTIAVIALNNARAKARDAKRIADVKQVQTALELFFNDKGRYPTSDEFLSGSIFSTSTLGTTTYMIQIPTASIPPDGDCLDTENQFSYTASPDGTDYKLSYCIGNTTGALAGGPHCATSGGISMGTGACCFANCTNRCNGASDGCGGTCEGLSSCASGEVCDTNNECCTANQPQNPADCRQSLTDNCGGSYTNNPYQDCGSLTCNTNTGNCELLCNGNVCSGSQVCYNNSCCLPANDQPSPGTDCRTQLDDGCGGTYSNNSPLTCDPSLTCDSNDGQCKCNGIVCGQDQHCSGGACVNNCTPNCSTSCAGDSDGCGGTCSDPCQFGQNCNSGVCSWPIVSCPEEPVVQYDGGTYDATGTSKNNGGYYRTIKICNVYDSNNCQCWLRDNLNVGTMINTCANGCVGDCMNQCGSSATSQTDNGTIEKFCYNDDSNICFTDGGLYQWNEMMQYSTIEGSQGICPPGWHIPSMTDYSNLSTILGGWSSAGLKMKDDISWDGNNASGFSALPAGARASYGSYYQRGTNSSLLTSSPVGGGEYWARGLWSGSDGVANAQTYYTTSVSVRCIRN